MAIEPIVDNRSAVSDSGGQVQSSWEIRVAEWIPSTRAEGPGQRCAIWFQGCPIRCPECCNPELFPDRGGTLLSESQVRDRLIEAVSQGSEGITLLGGEPLAQPEAATGIAETARELDLSVMLFTGWYLRELESGISEGLDLRRLLATIDILVEGRFDASQPETERRWIGSKNQSIHFLSNRYSPDDPDWRQPNTVEIRWVGGELLVNGFPVKDTPLGRAIELQRNRD